MLGKIRVSIATRPPAAAHVTQKDLSFCFLQLSLPFRLYSGFISLGVIFTLAAFFSHISNIQPVAFFTIYCCLIILSGMATSMLSATFGLAASYPPLYTQAVSVGQGR